VCIARIVCNLGTYEVNQQRKIFTFYMKWSGRIIAVNIEVPEELHKAMKKLAVDRDTTVKQLYAQAASELLKVSGINPIASPGQGAHTEQASNDLDAIQKQAEEMNEATSGRRGRKPTKGVGSKRVGSG
jgi:hypothetical protein